MRSVELPSSLATRIERAAATSYPHEACGVLVGEVGDGRIAVLDASPAENLETADRRARYTLDPKAFVDADREARDRGLDVVGFWHSHPDHPAAPSPTDLEHAWREYSYLIVSVDVGRLVKLRSWRLTEDGSEFEEEFLVITD